MKKLTILTLLLALTAFTLPVYAAKPLNLTEQANGKGYGLMTKEERTLAKETHKQNKIRNVQKFYFYPEGTDLVGTAEEPARYDYETGPWGKAVVKAKDGKVMYVGHNHAMDETYDLYYGDSMIGSGLSNEEGDILIKTSLPEEVDVTDEAFVWDMFYIKQVETTVLVSSTEHLKGMDYEEEMEEETTEM